MQATANWSVPFVATGKDAAAEVRTYCTRYGIPEDPWPWCGEAEDYETMHDFFCRSYAGGQAPPLGEAAVTQRVSSGRLGGARARGYLDCLERKALGPGPGLVYALRRDAPAALAPLTCLQCCHVLALESLNLRVPALR